MDIDYTDITYLKNPSAIDLQADYQQFLLSLAGLTIIDLTNQESKEWRVITTLINGDEPSGLIGLHRWLTSEERDNGASNLRIIICSVEAASHAPVFQHNYLSTSANLHLAFLHHEQLTDLSEAQQGVISRAELIKEKIKEVAPQAVIDIHNTAGNGPAFAKTKVITPEVLAITSFFCDTIIMSNMQLGELVEVDFNCPIIQLFCGAKNDEQAHEVAYQGISQFTSCQDFTLFDQQKEVHIVHKPLRMKLKPDVELSYGEHDEGEDGVTLKSSIEQFNYGSADVGQMLGWVDNYGLDNFELLSRCNENVIEQFFTLRDNQLVVAQPIKIFMATNNHKTAVNDCLFYLVKKTSN